MASLESHQKRNSSRARKRQTAHGEGSYELTAKALIVKSVSTQATSSHANLLFIVHTRKDINSHGIGFGIVGRGEVWLAVTVRQNTPELLVLAGVLVRVKAVE